MSPPSASAAPVPAPPSTAPSRGGQASADGGSSLRSRRAAASLQRDRLSYDALVARFGEAAVKAAARLHGATAEELRPEGTLKALAGAHDIATSDIAAVEQRHPHHRDHGLGTAPGSDDEAGNRADASVARSSRSQQRPRIAASGGEEAPAGTSPPASTGAAGAAAGAARPLTRDELLEAKRRAAWAVADEECQRLLTVVEGECTRQARAASASKRSASAAESRVEQLKRTHEARMRREKAHFAERLKRSVESTRAVMLRVRDETVEGRRRFEEEQRREEEEKAAAIDAFRRWQSGMRERADRERADREERERARAKALELQQWREHQAEQHQAEVQAAAERKRERRQGARAQSSRRVFDEAIRVRDEQRRQAEAEANDDATERLRDMAEQEREAHERWRTYQAYRRARATEASGRVNTVLDRARRVEEERQRAAANRLRAEEQRAEQWQRSFSDLRGKRRDEFARERSAEKRAYERAGEVEQDRKTRAAVTLEWLASRSEAQLAVLEQQRAVRQYEQHVVNAAMKRRADRAAMARELRAERTREEWTQKMDMGEERAQFRDEVTRRARREKERLAIVAQRMRWAAATGQPVDMSPIDNVLRRIERESPPPPPSAQRRSPARALSPRSGAVAVAAPRAQS